MYHQYSKTLTSFCLLSIFNSNIWIYSPCRRMTKCKIIPLWSLSASVKAIILIVKENDIWFSFHFTKFTYFYFHIESHICCRWLALRNVSTYWVNKFENNFFHTANRSLMTKKVCFEKQFHHFHIITFSIDWKNN